MHRLRTGGIVVDHNNGHGTIIPCTLSTIADAHAETLLLPDTDAELREVVRQLHSDGQAWIPALATRLDWSAPCRTRGRASACNTSRG